MSGEEIASLSKITTALRDAVHSRIVSGDDHWEGIYITSRIGDYFEIVQYPRASNLGLAFSPAKPQYTDARLISAEFPRLNWKRGSRLTDSGKPWFDWLSLSDDADPIIPPLNAWVMHYHFSHWPTSRMPSGPRVIDRFKRIDLEMGRDGIPALRELISWLPGTQTWDRERAILSLPQRDGQEFAVHIGFREGGANLSFRSVEMDITRGQVVTSGDYGAFALESRGDHGLILKKTA